MSSAIEASSSAVATTKQGTSTIASAANNPATTQAVNSQAMNAAVQLQAQPKTRVGILPSENIKEKQVREILLNKHKKYYFMRRRK